MLRSPSTPSIDTPRNFVKLLIGLWLFFTALFGLFSDWSFAVIMDEPMRGDGFLYSGLYSGFLLFNFGALWKPLNRKFPLNSPVNLKKQISIQFVVSAFGFLLVTALTKSMHDHMYDMEYAPYGKIGVTLSIVAMMCLTGMLATMIIMYTSVYIRRSLDAEKRQTESELSALRAQINPHFLFNSLNSIAALIRISPEKAESVTEDLADVFRYTLRASEHPLVLLKDELEIIRLYLNIEKARFAERLTVELDVPDDLLNTPIPVLTLQPLLENAMKHGVSKKEGNHRVKVSIQKVREVIQISVSDTGPGFQHTSFEELLTKGTGLSNIFQRLKLQFGESVDGAVSEHEISLRFPLQSLETSTEIQTLS